MDESVWANSSSRGKKTSPTGYFFASSCIIAFFLTTYAFSTSIVFGPRAVLPSIYQRDLQDTGSQYYGKPLVTIGCIPFDVNTPMILRQFEVSMASWLRCTAQVVLHLYDIVGGMGRLAPELIRDLQKEFGKERVFVRGKIVKKLKIETVPEAMEAIEANSQTIFCAWFSNDMILPLNWMSYVYAAMHFFGEYQNYSMHFCRRDLFESCRKSISLSDVVSPSWPRFFDSFKNRCRSRLHTLGYDCYLWNHRGINMTKAQVGPYYIGRPMFDGGIIKKQMQQGWFITAYPECETYHMEHPDRIQYTKRVNHPDSQYNVKIYVSEGSPAWRNEHFDLRISLGRVSDRRNGKWHYYSLNRKPGEYPLSGPAYRIENV